MNLFFNELSLIQAQNKAAAKEKMQQFMACFKEAQKEGFRELKVSESFLNTNIAQDYAIANWIDDTEVDIDDRRLLQIAALNTPFSEELLSHKERQNDRLFEFVYKQSPCLGLGLAYLYDTLSVSLIEKEWDIQHIEIIISYISDEDVEPVPRTEIVRHMCTTFHFALHKDWLAHKRKIHIQAGIQLWLRKVDLFPHLVFCPQVQKQLVALPNNAPELVQIIRKLSELNEAHLNWKEKETFDYKKLLHASPESRTRETQFKQELTIACPDGKNRFFTWHFRYTPGAGRIHFCVDNVERKIYIGYIGKKLL